MVFFNDMQPDARYMTKRCGWLTVITYIDRENVIVRFEDTGHERVAAAGNIRRGTVRDPLAKLWYGRGFEGVGKHEMRALGICPPMFSTWSAMLMRCYDERFQALQPTYRGCTTCEPWHNYQIFGDWFESKPNAGRFGYEIDKDLLVPGNRVYGPDTCCIVPRAVNMLFKGAGGIKSEYPAGVTYKNKSYIAQINIDGTRRHIGTYSTALDAHIAYCKRKIDVVHSTIREFASDVPASVFDRLIAMTWRDLCEIS